MKLFQYSYIEDFGDEWDFNFLKGRTRSFFQLFVSRPVYPSKAFELSVQLGSVQGLRFVLDLGIIYFSKSFFGKHFD